LVSGKSVNFHFFTLVTTGNGKKLMIGVQQCMPPGPLTMRHDWQRVKNSQVRLWKLTYEIPKIKLTKSQVVDLGRTQEELLKILGKLLGGKFLRSFQNEAQTAIC